MASSPLARAGRWAAAVSLAGMIALLLSGCAGPQARRLRRFEATLAANDSATRALEQWCAVERLGDPPDVTAEVLDTAPPREPADVRSLLGVGAKTPLGYRHVRLSCQGATLSLAHNWYVPDRLTPDMNRALAASHVPFGKVAAPLGYRRERLSSRRGPGRDCPTGTILSHRALLRLPDGRALALLVECYTAANLSGR